MNNYKTRPRAETEKNRVQALQSNILDIHTAQVKGTTYHRIVSPVATYKAGQSLCDSLTQQKIVPSCVVIRRP